jgi:hypothetical protein
MDLSQNMLIGICIVSSDNATLIDLQSTKHDWFVDHTTIAHLRRQLLVKTRDSTVAATP